MKVGMVCGEPCVELSGIFRPGKTANHEVGVYDNGLPRGGHVEIAPAGKEVAGTGAVIEAAPI